MSSGSACWILWLTPMDWLALSIGRSGSQPLEYSKIGVDTTPLNDNVIENATTKPKNFFKFFILLLPSPSKILCDIIILHLYFVRCQLN